MAEGFHQRERLVYLEVQLMAHGETAAVYVEWPDGRCGAVVRVSIVVEQVGNAMNSNDEPVYMKWSVSDSSTL